VRTVTLLDVRRQFDQIIKFAAAGERVVVERSGKPVVAIVPLADLELVDPEKRRRSRLGALAEIRQLATERPFPSTFDAVAALRKQRRVRGGTPMVEPRAE
jgi:prevent-host-death family protein